MDKSKKRNALKNLVKKASNKYGMHKMPNGKMMKDGVMEEKMEMDGMGGKGKKC